jgi:hypothetical protein
MVSRSRPEPERMARILESAKQDRLAMGLPAVDPSCVAYEQSQPEKKAKKRKGKKT